ncbi:hypothetical protein [Mycobacteroides sp. LB1]|uniref:hypothetical protein n=1 Tax=Mycobacteroides sp. LB1 TaxID=2750814 RepID=UPI0015DE5EF0|nr:hypothetical protein [Mycobacteroides sp. LB1]
MTVDQWLDLAVGLLAGGVIGTLIKSWVDRRNGKEANGAADWKAFATEQRETFKAAMAEQREAHNAAIALVDGRVTALVAEVGKVRAQLDTETKLLSIALAHLRELRAWITRGGNGEVPPLPEQLEGRL